MYQCPAVAPGSPASLLSFCLQGWDHIDLSGSRNRNGAGRGQALTGMPVCPECPHVASEPHKCAPRKISGAPELEEDVEAGKATGTGGNSEAKRTLVGNGHQDSCCLGCLEGQLRFDLEKLKTMHTCVALRVRG